MDPRSGDYALVEADGSLTLLGRGSSCINTAGEKVYPEEVEEVLKALPSVEDTLVFGVPDEEWGERVHAALRLRPGARLTADAVIAFCRARLADYKVPREVSFHDDFPRDAAGKLVKRLLRDPYWAGRATRV